MRIRISPTRANGATSGRRTSALGFTLVETVVATFATAIMLLALYACFAGGYTMIKMSREDLRATQIMLERMEAIRLSPYTDLAKYPASVTEYYYENGKSGGTGGVPYTVTFKAEAAPTSLPPSYRNNMMAVTVGVTWTNGNIPRSRSMQTYVARSGIQGYVADNY